MLDVADDMAMMREEIFGPLLPVVAYDDLDDAMRYVNGRDRPLALYWFGDNAVRRDRVLRGTIAGGVTVNGCLTHFAQEAQPFGGVGASGSGTYHGEYGFRTFSKEKPVYYQSRRGLLPMLLPPYGKLLDAVLACVHARRAAVTATRRASERGRCGRGPRSSGHPKRGRTAMNFDYTPKVRDAAGASRRVHGRARVSERAALPRRGRAQPRGRQCVDSQRCSSRS